MNNNYTTKILGAFLSILRS